MRNKKTLWKLILEEVEIQPKESIYKAMIKLNFSEEEGDSIFKECLDEEFEEKNKLQFINERLKFHSNISVKKICNNCKFWFGRQEKFNEMGDCLKISDDNLPADVGCIGKIEDEKEGTIVVDGGIITGKNFGCVHFEKES